MIGKTHVRQFGVTVSAQGDWYFRPAQILARLQA